MNIGERDAACDGADVRRAPTIVGPSPTSDRLVVGRRDLLRAGAALPAAAALTRVALPAAAAPKAPGWGWYAAPKGCERHHVGPEASREGVLAALAAEPAGEYDVVEARPETVDLRIDGEDLLRMIDEANDAVVDHEGDCTVFPNDLPLEATEDLADVVEAAVRDWARRRGVTPEAWAFGEVRNRSVVRIGPDPAGGGA